MKEFGYLVRDRRREKKLKAAQLAEQVGVTPSWISKLETGKAVHYPSPEEVHRLGKALDLPDAFMLAAMGYLRTTEEQKRYEEFIHKIANDIVRMDPILQERVFAFINSLTEDQKVQPRALSKK